MHDAVTPNPWPKRSAKGVVVLLLAAGILILYAIDSATVKQAVVVDQYLKDYCLSHNSYPAYATLESAFPELYPNGEWFYWPNESLSVASFQYPMTLPLPTAPGSAKMSEFVPVIYSYAVRDPCKGLIKGIVRGNAL